MGNLPTRTQKMMGERIAEVNPSGERGSLPQLSLLPFPWSWSLVSSLALLKGHKLTLKRELLSLSFFLSLPPDAPVPTSPSSGLLHRPSATLGSGLCCVPYCRSPLTFLFLLTLWAWPPVLAPFSLSSHPHPVPGGFWTGGGSGFSSLLELSEMSLRGGGTPRRIGQAGVASDPLEPEPRA